MFGTGRFGSSAWIAAHRRDERRRLPAARTYSVTPFSWFCASGRYTIGVTASQSDEVLAVAHDADDLAPRAVRRR